MTPDGCNDASVVTRVHTRPDGTHSTAIYSPCAAYRYRLDRVWDEAAGLIVYIMLNPSTADETRNDPTIERCERRARMLGFGGITIVNLFGFRATRPADLKAATAPVGPLNDAMLDAAAQDARLILCAWGVHGAHLDRHRIVAARLNSAGHMLHILGLTREGLPRHPLYMPYRCAPELWTP